MGAANRNERTKTKQPLQHHHVPGANACVEIQLASSKARLRSEQAMERALAALHRMDAADREINFRTVAAEAKVSTAWLYGQEELRVRIMRSRRTTSHMAPPASASQDRERLSRQNIVATLRLRIKAVVRHNVIRERNKRVR